MQEELSPEIREQMKQAAREHIAQSANDSDLSPEIRAQMKIAAEQHQYNNVFQDYMKKLEALDRNPLTIPGNIAYGTGQLVRHGGNAALQILEALGINPGKIGIPNQISEESLGLDKMIPSETANSGVAEAARMIGGGLPLMALGGSGIGAGKMLSPLAKEIPTGLKAIGDYASKFTKNLFAGAAAAPLFREGNIADVAREALTDPLNISLSALGPGFQAGSDITQRLKQKFNQAGGVNNTEEVIRNLEALKNTLGNKKVPPGQIIKSPSVNWMQSLLAMNPGSAMSKYLLDVGHGFQDFTNKTLKKMLPEGKGIEGKTSIPEDVSAEVKKNYSDKIDKHLANALDKLSGKENTLSNRGSILQDIQGDIKNNYTNRIDSQLESGLQKMTSDPDVLRNLPKYRAEIQEDFSKKFNTDKKEIEKAYKEAEISSKTRGETILPIITVDKMEPLYQEMTEELNRNPQAPIDKSLYHELQALHDIKYPSESSGQSIILNKEGNPIYSLSKAQESVEKNARPLSSVNAFRKKYWDKAEDAYRQGRRKDAAAWKQLWSGYTEDIDSQLSEESGKLWKQANKDYREKLAPIYNSDELLPHALKSIPPDTIVENILKTGNAEKPTLLKAFTDRLSLPSKGKLAALHYTKPLRQSNGKTVIEPEKILSQHDKLADQTRSILLGNSSIKNDIDLLNNNFDKDLYQYGTGEKAPETLINKYIRSGAYERPDLAKKLLNVLSPENKGKAAVLQATKGMKNQINPKKLFNNIQKLDPETQNLIYKDKPRIKKIFDIISKTYHDNLYNYGKGNIPPDKIISEFLPGTKEESPTKAKLLLNALSPEGRLAVGAHKISGGRRSITEEDRKAGATLAESVKQFNQIGKRTQNSIFRNSPDIQKSFQDLSRATGLYPDINPMFMPRNGITMAGQEPLRDMLNQASKIVSGSEKIPAAAKIIAQLLAKSGLGNLATNHLMSEDFIKKYLESRQKLTRKNKNNIPISVLNQVAQGNQ